MPVHESVPPSRPWPVRPDLTAARRLVAAPIITRFAPSPTGLLHLGHVVNAIYVWGLARALDGQVLVRIEDHDRIRSRDAFDAALIDDLRWLGFAATEPGAIVRQSERDALYQDALARLRRVAHVYACECSRAHYSGERYPGHCRTRGLAETPGRSLRMQIEPGVETAIDLAAGTLQQEPARQAGDLLLRDRDGHWTYQFAVTVDDLLQDVSLVVRGADLMSSTGRQVHLGRQLHAAGVGVRTWPPRYLHHPLILDRNGRKLSKSTGATGVRALRDAGVPPAQVIGRAAAASGLVNEPLAIDAEDVVRLFDA
jgi:glutamyl/glutaminyl-tRNA synthetase